MELLTGENEDEGGDVIGGFVDCSHTTIVIMAY